MRWNEGSRQTRSKTAQKQDVAALHTEFVRDGLPRISDSGAAREVERVLRVVVTQNGCGRA